MNQLGVPVICLAFFGAVACARVNNEFVVKDPDGVVNSAVVRLCSNRVPLTRYEGYFSGKMPITCEGEGTILLHLSTDLEILCPIGYVTPGAEQVFEYIVKDGHCQ